MITIYYGHLKAQISPKKAQKYGLMDGQQVSEKVFNQVKKFFVL